MESTQAIAGKKVKLEVFAEDAPGLREQGMDLFKALQGQTIKPDDHVRFGKFLLDVKATKPKGPVTIMGNTAIKMSISKKPVVMSCPHCGKQQEGMLATCMECGQELDLVSL